jgi:hypothetical protein
MSTENTPNSEQSSETKNDAIDNAFEKATNATDKALEEGAEKTDETQETKGTEEQSTGEFTPPAPGTEEPPITGTTEETPPAASTEETPAPEKTAETPPAGETTENTAPPATPPAAETTTPPATPPAKAEQGKTGDGSEENDDESDDSDEKSKKDESDEISISEIGDETIAEIYEILVTHSKFNFTSAGRHLAGENITEQNLRDFHKEFKREGAADIDQARLLELLAIVFDEDDEDENLED